MPLCVEQRLLSAKSLSVCASACDLLLLRMLYTDVRAMLLQIFEYNGAAIVAMAGKDCIAIGSDLRFGVQFQTLATDYKKVYQIHDKLYIGLAGLGTDAQTM